MILRIIEQFLICLIVIILAPLSGKSVVFAQTVSTNLKADSTVVLYFTNVEWEQVPVTRRLEGPITPKVLVEELLKGPKSEGSLRSNFPKGTKVLNVKIKEGIAFVNFNEEFNTNYTNEMGVDWLRSTLFTLLGFPEVQGVQFLINGKTQEIIGNDGTWIGSPYGKEYTINDVPESTGSRVVGNLYVPELIDRRIYLVPHTLSSREKNSSQDLQSLLSTLFARDEMHNLRQAVKDRELKGDTVFLNLDSERFCFPDKEGRSLKDVISAVAYTISEIPDVRFLKIFVDGTPIPSKYGIEPIQKVPENPGDIYVLPVGINPE